MLVVKYKKNKEEWVKFLNKKGEKIGEIKKTNSP